MFCIVNNILVMIFTQDDEALYITTIIKNLNLGFSCIFIA